MDENSDAEKATSKERMGAVIKFCAKAGMTPTVSWKFLTQKEALGNVVNLLCLTGTSILCFHDFLPFSTLYRVFMLLSFRHHSERRFLRGVLF